MYSHHEQASRSCELDRAHHFDSVNKVSAYTKYYLEDMRRHNRYHRIQAYFEQSWASAMHNLRTLYKQRSKKDDAFRKFAAEKLTELTNDWLEDDDAAEITQKDFARRIRISKLNWMRKETIVSIIMMTICSMAIA